MSFAVFQQLCPASLVDSCVFASFTKADANNLVLTRGDRLEVYNLNRQQNKLVLAFSASLFGRPECVCSFRPQADAPENLAIVFRQAKYLSVLSYDPELGSVRTCGQNLLIASTDPAAASLQDGFRPQIVVDPEQRCLAVRSLADRLVVFPSGGDSSRLVRDAGPGLLPSHQDPEQPCGLRAPFQIQAWSHLRLHHVEDIAFLAGYQRPTMACLGQASPSWGGCINQGSKGQSSLLIVVLDLTAKTRHIVWASQGLSHDLFRLVPLPQPTAGVLAVANNSVTYLKEHGVSFCQALNAGGLETDQLGDMPAHGKVRDESKLDILLTSCSAVVLSPTVVLFSIHPTGRLYFAHLILMGQDTVCEIVWTSPGQSLPAWELCCARTEDFVFLAGTSGSSNLLRIQPSKKKLPSSLQPLKRPKFQHPGEKKAKPVVHTETKTDIKEEEKTEDNAEEKTDEKPEENADDKPEEKADDKSEQKTEGETEEKTHDKTDEKMEEPEGGKLEEKAEEKPDVEMAEVVKPEEKRKAISEKLKELMDIYEKLRDDSRFIRSYTVEITDELPAIGPFQSLQPWCEAAADEDAAGEKDTASDKLWGTRRFLGCTGSGSKGALQVLQRAVPLETLTEFDLPGGVAFGAVWSLRQAPEEPIIAEVGSKKRPLEEEGEGEASEAHAASQRAPHRFVLCSGPSRSMLLETTEEIEEISKSTPLDMESPTVGAGSVLRSRVVVQLTAARACFMYSARGSTAATPAPVPFPPAVGSSAVPAALSASVCDPYVAVRFEGGSLRLFVVDETDAGALSLRDISDRLPKGLATPASVSWASLLRDRSSGRVLLSCVLPAGQGTLSISDLAGIGGSRPTKAREVFRAERLGEVPAVLRGSLSPGADNEAGNTVSVSGADGFDHLRSLTDVCAPLPRGAVETQLSKADDAEASSCAVISAELLYVDPDDVGPTLAVVVHGRPLLIYRAFQHQVVRQDVSGKVAAGQAASFPWSFSLVEHDFLGLVQAPPAAAGWTPYQPVAMLSDAAGQPNGAVLVPPHAGLPALWLAARRNQLFVHPLPGCRRRGFAGLSAPCCGSGFFSLLEHGQGRFAAQVSGPATLDAFPEDEAGFDLRQPVPVAKHALQRTPKCLATKPEDGLLGIAVTEMVVESASVPPGPSPDEDPLSEDWSIIRDPPVKELDEPARPRMQPRHELWIENAKELSKLGRFRFTFDTEEAVLCLAWVNLPGFPQPSLAVGTGVNTGEDLTCRGRLLLFSIKDREPGILPPVYQRSVKWPVTVVGQFSGNLVHSEGFKLFVEKWENSSFTKLAFFDGNMCMTAMSSIKNFLLFGDLRKGLDFCQWKEEAATGTRTVRRLSRSPPSAPMTVLACEFIVHNKSLGMVALDHKGTAHLFQYTPHSDGREGDQLLRSCATFAMGSPCRAVLRLPSEQGIQSLFMATGSGELLCVRPIDDQAYRTITSLLGMLFTRLPFRCGLNPRAFRSGSGQVLVAPRKNIEDAVLLRQFAFLSTPLQASIAEKMRLSVPALLKATAPFASNSLFSLPPASAAA
eukprot:TRINITY_DN19257_c0_g1_i1.p1 TRINITY_DN19257_c0_g1~~TRINITY_DN19257_c0_g1_i1.p1  ORF type:complete len:1549 (-),score=302.72 TRINITY_DN19257_c0_g1_i1:13-4632(-)